MDLQMYKEFRARSTDGSLRDEDNPIFIFSVTNNAMLAFLMNPEIDIRKMVHRELCQRGLDSQGTYIGFTAASDEFRKIYGEKPY